MSEGRADPKGSDSVESGLRLQLARGDAVISSVSPVLRHLLVHHDQALFSDDILARLRAMLGDLARQVDDVLVAAGAPCAGRVEALAMMLPDVPGLLAHLHALSLEWKLTQRLQDCMGLDPVLSPLLQALIASNDADVSARAMKLLAAQARFAQGQRRMQLPLGELPAELLHGVLVALHQAAQEDAAAGDAARRAEAALCARYDEATTRLGLLARLVSGMGAGAVAGLALAHAGCAIFVTALALSDDLNRDHTMLTLQHGQEVRLVLALRAAGVKLSIIEENLLALHPHAAMPDELARLSVERAGELLVEAGAGAGLIVGDGKRRGGLPR
jgi:hypothetical protein